jgi:hypothetical protein
MRKGSSVNADPRGGAVNVLEEQLAHGRWAAREAVHQTLMAPSLSSVRKLDFQELRAPLG